MVGIRQHVNAVFQRGDLSYCIDRTRNTIAGMPATPFHQVLTVDFTNDPQQIAQAFDEFFTKYRRSYSLVGAAAGMNGFFINPALWYFEISTWEAEGRVWISDEIPLTGMETIQQLYDEALADPDQPVRTKGIRDFCDLLILFNYVDLIVRSARLITLVDVPISIGVHDYEEMVLVVRKP